MDKERLKLTLALHARQGLVITSPANELLFGGGAGGGKSHLTRVLAIKFCAEIPGFHAAIFRRTFPEIKATFFEGPGSFPMLLADAQQRGVCKVVKNEIRFANGSRITANHCHSAEDRFQYQGMEIHLLCIDEATHFPQAVYEYLRTRLRLGNLVVPAQYAHKLPMVLLTSNPGGIGHNWIKEGWIDSGAFKLVRMPPERGGMLRQYIPSLYTDNVYAMQNDPTYRERLMAAGDPETARALLHGDWDVVAGSMFGAVWQRHLHVVTSRPIPAGWDLWRGADDGFAAPACVLWFARDPVHQRTYVVSELYKEGMLPEEMASRVLARDKDLAIEYPDGEIKAHGAQLSGILDPASWANVGSGSPSRGDAMNRLGCKWTAAQKPTGSRVTGVQHIQRMLAVQADGLPKLQIFTGCTNLVKALPTAPRDADNAEDIDPEFELDHAVDALRYGLQWRDRSFKKQKWGGM